MKLKILKENFSVCKVESVSQINFEDEYCFLGKTDEELSLVCSTKSVPSECIERDDNWFGFRIVGILDFSLIGILSKISTILADSQIGIFVISTFNTDYIFIKNIDKLKAIEVLENQGYEIE